MTDEYDAQVDGITFYFDSSQVQEAQGTEKFRVRLVLNCFINDEALWKEAETKFHAGHRVFTRADFHTEVLEVMRLELKDLKEKNEELERELKRTRGELTLVTTRYNSLSNALSEFNSAVNSARR